MWLEHGEEDSVAGANENQNQEDEGEINLLIFFSYLKKIFNLKWKMWIVCLEMKGMNWKSTKTSFSFVSRLSTYAVPWARNEIENATKEVLKIGNEAAMDYGFCPLLEWMGHQLSGWINKYLSMGGEKSAAAVDFA